MQAASELHEQTRALTGCCEALKAGGLTAVSANLQQYVNERPQHLRLAARQYVKITEDSIKIYRKESSAKEAPGKGLVMQIGEEIIKSLTTKQPQPVAPPFAFEITPIPERTQVEQLEELYNSSSSKIGLQHSLRRYIDIREQYLHEAVGKYVAITKENITVCDSKQEAQEFKFPGLTLIMQIGNEVVQTGGHAF